MKRHFMVFFMVMSSVVVIYPMVRKVWMADIRNRLQDEIVGRSLDEATTFLGQPSSIQSGTVSVAGGQKSNHELKLNCEFTLWYSTFPTFPGIETVELCFDQRLKVSSVVILVLQ